MFRSCFAPQPDTPRVVYAASVAINLLALALPLTILQVYDRVLPHASFQTLNALLVGLLGVIIVDISLKHSKSVVSNWIGAAYAHNTSRQAIRTILTATPNPERSRSIATHLERLSSISSLGDHIASPARNVKVDVLFVPIFAFVILLVGGILFVVPVLLFCIFGCFSFYRTRLLYSEIKKQEKIESRKSDFMIEALRSISTIKSHAMEASLLRRFERLQLASSDTLRQIILLTSAAQTYATTFAAVSTIAIISTGAFLVVDQKLTVGGLACCMLLSSQLIQPLTRIMASWNELQLAEYNQQKVEAIFENENSSLAAVGESAKKINAGPAAIQMNGVCIQHGNSRPLIENINLNVAAGELVAIRGGDGSGKSSLLRTLTGTIVPKHGTVRFGDTELSPETQPKIRRAVRYVGQEAVIFQGTILENLTTFGKASVSSAINASKLIGLDNEIIRMPKGYDTRIENVSGHEIPASTAQRISIARSIALRPSVLILDEANTALDMIGEKALANAIIALRGKQTVIVATHRPNLIRLADKAYEISDKKIATIETIQNQKTSGL
ncbi:MAG: ATP-binding cassette domain-containing protein [Marinicaulis sp.]|nr:ATP-binding cassette domain-containing protein [Marinicaulis sp.]